MLKFITVTIFCSFIFINPIHASTEWSENCAWNIDTSYYPYNNYISWVYDESDSTSDVPVIDAYTAISLAITEWSSAFNFTLLEKEDLGGTYDSLSGGTDWSYANIVFGGWLDSAEWTQLGGGSDNIALAWPATIRDLNGNRVDYDSNGYWDLAQVIIYFNESYSWGTDIDDVTQNGKFDIQSVALHEIGHALGLVHTPYSEDSVMAGAISSGVIQRDITEIDCQNLDMLYPAAAVPEPSAIFLFLFGLAIKPLIAKRSKN